jgi:hypothetical protein
MNMRKTAVLLSLPLVAFGCGSLDTEVPTSSDCDDIRTSYFQKLTIPERMQNFRSLDLDKQYAVYICGNRVIHPPALYLAETFAREGAVAVPFLKQKLLATKKDTTVRHIIDVFNQMQYFKTYDVAADTDLMSAIVTRAEKIDNKEWREYTKRNIRQIQTLAQEDPFHK